MAQDLIETLNSIGFEDAFADSDGHGVRVGVVDSGVEENHEALDGCVEGGVQVTFQDGAPHVEECSPVVDDFGHGTACAGIIHWVAPRASVYSVKVLGSSNSGQGEAFLAGLDWAIDNRLDVINLSLGTTNQRFLTSFYELADKAYYAGCILVAAGNNVPPPSIPSILSSLISVDCREFPDRSHFTFHPGRTIEIDAHGVDVMAPWVGDTYRQVTGTSFATPHVTGVVARIRARYPELTPFELKTVLCSLGRRTAQTDQLAPTMPGSRAVRAARQGHILDL